MKQQIFKTTTDTINNLTICTLLVHSLDKSSSH